MIQKTRNSEYTEKINRKNIITLIIVLLIVMVWVYWSGIGGYVWQNADHYWRNEIYEILVEYKWPVIQGTPVGGKGISYYIGFWMVPAIFGKLFGVSVGYVVQYVWAVVGIMLMYGLMCRRFKRIAVLPIIIFIFFSGLDIVGYLINNYTTLDNIHIGTHLELWIDGYQFSSITTQLFWVFNQAIYAWLITLIIIDERNNAIVPLMSAGLLSATLPMVGLFPIALCVIHNNIKKESKENGSSYGGTFVRSCITYENIVGGICTLILGALFIGNNATGTIENKATQNNNIISYLFFIIIEIGIYVVLTIRREYKNNIYMMGLLSLLICPFIIIGAGTDFCMRACIPGQIILFIAYIEYIYDVVARKRVLQIIVLSIFLLIGAITPINEFARTVIKNDSYVKHGKLVARKDEIFEANNFTVDLEENLFYKNVSK